MTEWMGISIPIELHHIDGNRFNNKLDNLQILCPNCHALTDNYSGRKLNNDIKVKTVKVKNTCGCGVFIKKSSKSCVKCFQMKQRIVNRPSKDELLNAVNEFGYSAMGRKYGVSDNAIRKWLKN